MNWVAALTIAAALLGASLAVVGVIVARSSLDSGRPSLGRGETLTLTIPTHEGEQSVVITAQDDLSPDALLLLFRILTDKGRINRLFSEELDLHGPRAVVEMVTPRPPGGQPTPIGVLKEDLPPKPLGSIES